MVSTPTLHLNNPVLQTTPDLTGLFKDINDTVSNIESTKKETNKENLNRIDKLADVDISSITDPIAQKTAADMLNTLSSDLMANYAAKKGNLFGIKNMGYDDIIEQRKLVNKTKGEINQINQWNNNIKDIQARIKSNDPTIDIDASRQALGEAYKDFSEGKIPDRSKFYQPDANGNYDASQLGLGENPLIRYRELNPEEEAKKSGVSPQGGTKDVEVSVPDGKGNMIKTKQTVKVDRNSDNAIEANWNSIIKAPTGRVHASINKINQFKDTPAYQQASNDFDKIMQAPSDQLSPTQQQIKQTGVNNEDAARSMYIWSSLNASKIQKESAGDISVTKPIPADTKKAEAEKEYSGNDYVTGKDKKGNTFILGGKAISDGKTSSLSSTQQYYSIDNGGYKKLGSIISKPTRVFNDVGLVQAEIPVKNDKNDLGTIKFTDSNGNSYSGSTIPSKYTLYYKDGDNEVASDPKTIDAKLKSGEIFPEDVKIKLPEKAEGLPAVSTDKTSSVRENILRPMTQTEAKFSGFKGNIPSTDSEYKDAVAKTIKYEKGETSGTDKTDDILRDKYEKIIQSGKGTIVQLQVAKDWLSKHKVNSSNTDKPKSKSDIASDPNYFKLHGK